MRPMAIRLLYIVLYLLLLTFDKIEGQKRSKREVFNEDPLLVANLFEGDIAGVDIQTLNDVVNGTALWPDQSIPYVIDIAVGYVARRAIAKAITAIESKTCVRFRNATETDEDYIVFVPDKGLIHRKFLMRHWDDLDNLTQNEVQHKMEATSTTAGEQSDKANASFLPPSARRTEEDPSAGRTTPKLPWCYSYVGKQGGQQLVSMGDGCEQVGTVLHLLMHVLGFWHEESRLDRDLYILINWDNIDSENAKHFEKYTIPRINVESAMDPSSSAYDYESITHISPFAYARDKSIPSILTKDERFKIGQRLDLSENDVSAIVKAYCSQRQTGPAADMMTLTQEEKAIYEKTVEQQTGLNKEERQQEVDEGHEDESTLINPEQPEGCRDTSRKCPLWATQGLCYKNPTVMAVKCAGSCQACQMIATCDNFNSLCGIWAWLGNCVGKSAQKYLAACPLACGVCVPEGTRVDNETVSGAPFVIAAGPLGSSQPLPPTTAGPPVSSMKPVVSCGDKHRNCQKWALKGRCFYKYVQGLCPGACNATCDQPLPNAHSAEVGAGKGAHREKPPTAAAQCRDKRKNCAKFVPRGFCQRPGFRKQCQLSCNLCDTEVRARDSPFPEERYYDDSWSSQHCHDYSLSVCSGMQEEQATARCNAHSYVRRLCPHKCRMCHGGEEYNLKSGGDKDSSEVFRNML